MEKPGKLDRITSDGKEVYSTEKETSPEEKELILKKQQKLVHDQSLWLQGKGPDPYEKKDQKKDNLLKFPKQSGEGEKEKAA